MQGKFSFKVFIGLLVLVMLVESKNEGKLQSRVTSVKDIIKLELGQQGAIFNSILVIKYF